MASLKPEVPLAQLVDNMGTTFQRLLLFFYAYINMVQHTENKHKNKENDINNQCAIVR